MKGPSREQEPKVVSGYGTAGKGLTPEISETLRDEQQKAEAQSRIEAIKQVSRNKFAQMIGAGYVIYDWTHPCLFMKDRNAQTSVTEFYAEHSLAVDKFFHFDEWEMRLTQFKKEALTKAGFKYVCLTPDKDMADAWAELESQGVKVG